MTARAIGGHVDVDLLPLATAAHNFTGEVMCSMAGVERPAELLESAKVLIREAMALEHTVRDAIETTAMRGEPS
jgi:hypothetical protein